MSKTSAHAKPRNSTGLTRSTVASLERRHTFGPHVCVQPDVTGLATHLSALTLVRDRVESPGQPSDAAVGSQMESRFGHEPVGPVGGAFTRPKSRRDFSDVPMHGNARAAEAIRSTPVPFVPFSPSVEQHDYLDQRSNPKPTATKKSTVVEHHRQPFSAVIRCADKGAPSLSAGHASGDRSAMRPRTPGFYNDAMAGGEEAQPIDFTALSAESASAESIPEPQVGETVQVPDIVIPSMAANAQTDAVAATLTYNPSISQSGPPPSPFGATLPYTHALSGISITRAATTYSVTATVDNPITFQVDGGSNTDIASDSDPDITQANYPTVVSDLTPDMSELNGKPPRDDFWAEDLTIKHERFHADEDVTFGRSGVTLAQQWLSTKTASSVADVNHLLGQVPTRVAQTVNTAMAWPGREERAYGDGAPAYLARATAIKTKGDANGYATGSGPSAPGSASPGASGTTGLSRGAKVGIGVGGSALAGAGIGALAGGGVGALVGAGIGAAAGLIGGLIA
jgi:hypothetical protein